MAVGDPQVPLAFPEGPAGREALLPILCDGVPHHPELVELGDPRAGQRAPLPLVASSTLPTPQAEASLVVALRHPQVPLAIPECLAGRQALLPVLGEGIPHHPERVELGDPRCRERAALPLWASGVEPCPEAETILAVASGAPEGAPPAHERPGRPLGRVPTLRQGIPHHPEILELGDLEGRKRAPPLRLGAPVAEPPPQSEPPSL